MARAAAVLCIVGHGFRADAMAALRMAPSAARDHAFMGMALEEERGYSATCSSMSNIEQVSKVSKG